MASLVEIWRQTLIFSALSWFKDRFVKCNERATLVKTWLPAQQQLQKTFLDQLVYDRALALVGTNQRTRQGHYSRQSRTAARKELLDQASSRDECEKLYEESLWCLYALQDDLLQSGNQNMDEDQRLIADCKSVPCSSFC